MPLSEENTARSSLVELTSLPEGSVDGANILSPTSRGVGGVLWPLPSVVPRLTKLRRLGAGDGVWSQSNKEVH